MPAKSIPSATQLEDTPLRIAIVIERFVPGAGGVENVAWQVAHELRRAGDAVTVIARETAPTPHVETHTLRVPRAWQPLRVLAFSHAANRCVQRRAMTAEAFDVVHSFSRTRHQDLFRAGGGSHDDYLRRSHAGLAQRVRRLSPRHRTLLDLEARVFADSRQRIQCASKLVADVLVDRHRVGRDRILLLPNGVDIEGFASASVVEAGRRFRVEHAPEASRVWLFPASGWARKGLGALLAALARLDDPGLQLWIAGRDDPRPWRRRAARLGVESALRFLGERKDLARIYHAVDGMVLPTRYDAFANVTLEAAAAGLPIITTAANGAAEWLPDELVVLDEADDVDGIAQALTSLRDEHTRRELGGRAARRAQAFSWSAHVERLRVEYRRIVAARAPSRPA